MSSDKETWLWLPHEEDVWIVVRVVDAHSEQIELADMHNNKYFKTRAEVDALAVVQSSSMEGGDDMINLSELFDGAILNTLRDRYHKDVIYTNIANIVIAINPYKRLDLYTPEIMGGYRSKSLDAPHPYAVGDNAFNGMKNDHLIQSIIISGDSGSGKTETTKIILRYLSFMSGKSSAIEKQILDANPLIEAFGNAKTVRNNNSSRFGKWVEVNFDTNFHIEGGSIQHFLLEQSRIFTHDKGERNFHIFYQMCAGMAASPKDQEMYGLGAASEYHYLGGATDRFQKIAGVDEVAEYKITIAAMHTLQFSPEEVKQVLQVTAGVLHLGNVTFVKKADGDGCQLAPAATAVLTKVCELLGMSDPGALVQALTQRIQAFSKEETVTIPFSPEQAVNARDALAKLLYTKVFDYVIQKINMAMASSMGGGGGVIGGGDKKKRDIKGDLVGVLDIFGFESFDTNRFEQLCINYTNEKLQQHFNHNVFTLEQQVYAAEDVKVDHVKFIDNQLCLDLIEDARFGLLAMLDEELVLPKGSDENLNERFKKQNKTSPHYKPVNKTMSATDDFGIKHYAGVVYYQCAGFLEKNRNEVNPAILDLAYSSTTLLSIFGAREEEAKAGAGGRPKVKTSIGTLFKNSLKSLMETLNQSVPHFVRCMKPNGQQKPNLLEASLVIKQLADSGVQSVVEIRQQGYPFRLELQQFYRRFAVLSVKKEEEKIINGSKDAVQHRAVCEAFCKRVEELITEKEHYFAIGRSRVFLRANAHRDLERLRKEKIFRAISLVQGSHRRKKARLLVEELRRAQKALAAAVEVAQRDEDLVTLLKGIASAESKGLKNHDWKKAVALREQMKKELGVVGDVLVFMEMEEWDSGKASSLLKKAQTDGKDAHPHVKRLALKVAQLAVDEELKRLLTQGGKQEKPKYKKCKELLVKAAELGMVRVGVGGDDSEKDLEELYPLVGKAELLIESVLKSITMELALALASTKTTDLTAAIAGAQELDVTSKEAPVLTDCVELLAAIEQLEKEVEPALAAKDIAILDGLLKQVGELGLKHLSATLLKAQKLVGSNAPLEAALTKAMEREEGGVGISHLALAQAIQVAKKANVVSPVLDKAIAMAGKEVDDLLAMAIAKGSESLTDDYARALDRVLEAAKLFGLSESASAVKANTLIAQMKEEKVRKAKEAEEAAKKKKKAEEEEKRRAEEEARQAALLREQEEKQEVLRAELAVAQAKVEAAAKEREEEQQKQEAEKKQQEEALKKAESELELLRAQAGNSQSEQATALAQAQSQQDELQKQLDELRSQFEDQAASLQAVEADKQTLQAEKDKIEDEKTALESKLAALEADNVNQREALERLTQEHGLLTSTAKATEELLQKSVAQIQAVEGEKGESGVALLAAQTKVSELTIALEKERAAHEEKRVANEALEKSKAELTNVLAVKEQEAVVATEARTKNEKSLTESINEAKAEGKRLADELKAVTTEAKISSDALASANSKVEALSTELGEEKSKRAGLQAEVDAMKHSAIDLSGELERQKKETLMQEKTRELLEQERSKASGAGDKWMEKYEKSMEKTEALLEKVADMNNTLSEQKNSHALELQAIMQQAAESKKQLEERTKALEAAKQELVEKEQELQKQKEQIAKTGDTEAAAVKKLHEQILEIQQSHRKEISELEQMHQKSIAFFTSEDGAGMGAPSSGNFMDRMRSSVMGALPGAPAKEKEKPLPPDTDEHYYIRKVVRVRRDGKPDK